MRAVFPEDYWWLPRRLALQVCFPSGPKPPPRRISQHLPRCWDRSIRRTLRTFLKLRAPGDPGIPLHVSGKVFNTRGEAVPGAQIDIWQTDHEGHYDLQGFRYRTKLALQTAPDYSVETVMPGHYDDRPAQHIHYMITAPGHKTLITQLYFATDPFFEGNPDQTYRKRSIVGNRELIRPVLLFERPGAAHARSRSTSVW